jgi:hypothetical protein
MQFLCLLSTELACASCCASSSLTTIAVLVWCRHVAVETAQNKHVLRCRTSLLLHTAVLGSTTIRFSFLRGAAGGRRVTTLEY